jgi:serine/threonine protein kinase
MSIAGRLASSPIELKSNIFQRAKGSGNARDEFTTPTIASGEAAAGTVIGLYHLLELIGQGGMGEVWLAEQKEPVRRRVAIKLIKAGMDTREVVARFESERQALALMDHPNIAKVFDAGQSRVRLAPRLSETEVRWEMALHTKRSRSQP